MTGGAIHVDSEGGRGLEPETEAVGDAWRWGSRRTTPGALVCPPLRAGGPSNPASAPPAKSSGVVFSFESLPEKVTWPVPQGICHLGSQGLFP